MKYIRLLTLSVLILNSSVLQTFAHYHPDEGRWLSRDPVGEKGFYVSRVAASAAPNKSSMSVGKITAFREAQSQRAAYLFVGNQSVNRLDVLGLFLFGCCGDKVYFKPLQCCCGGKDVHWRGIGKPTGVVICSGWKTQNGVTEFHTYLSSPEGSAGFYPGQAIFGGRGDNGIVKSPDPFATGSAVICLEQHLDPCEYDIDNFKKCIASRIKPADPSFYVYNLLTFHCEHWAELQRQECVEAAKRKKPCQ